MGRCGPTSAPQAHGRDKLSSPRAATSVQGMGWGGCPLAPRCSRAWPRHLPGRALPTAPGPPRSAAWQRAPFSLHRHGNARRAPRGAATAVPGHCPRRWRRPRSRLPAAGTAPAATGRPLPREEPAAGDASPCPKSGGRVGGDPSSDCPPSASSTPASTPAAPGALPAPAPPPAPASPQHPTPEL